MSSSSADVRTGTRSRNACLNCRRKKVKCQGEQPSCSFCARLLQKCVYPSRRWTVTSDGNATSTTAAGKNKNYEGLASRMALIESQLSRICPTPESSSLNIDDVPSPTKWTSPTASSYDMSQLSLNGYQSVYQAFAQPIGQSSAESSILPPFPVLMSTVDMYFNRCHSQPYCFFHEETFRKQLSNNELPEYLILAVLVMAIRFSQESFYANNDQDIIARYASEAWKEVVRQSFESEDNLDYRLVQAATLLAIHDFTSCRHGTAWIKIGVAVSMAQALHLMTEPPTTLTFSAQEERRRTLWSIYLLDKLATCGRYRPSLFLDRTIQLHLPCSEFSFETSSPEQVPTLEDFPSLTDAEIANLKSFAPSIALASVLSKAANYAFEHDKSGGQKLPWDHTSEYQSICSQLSRFETFFDCYGDLQMHILNGPLPQQGGLLQITESTIFSYVVYNLCYCLLQHPFLLRRRLEKCETRIPTSFLAQAISSSSRHAQELTQTLTNARRSQHKVAATFFSYASVVAGSIHCLQQHSPDGLARLKSAEALQGSLAHLIDKAKYWKNSSRMVTALTQFSDASVRYSSLLDPSLQNVPLEPADIERLYALCDYGTMSASQYLDSLKEGKLEAESNNLLNSALTIEPTATLEHDDYSGHIDGIIPQMFGHADTSTMMNNLSFALQDYTKMESATGTHTWHG